MFETLSRSWEFAKISFGIIWDYRRLIMFPIVSSIMLLVVSVSFFVPLTLIGTLETWVTQAEGGHTGSQVALFFSCSRFTSSVNS